MKRAGLCTLMLCALHVAGCSDDGTPPDDGAVPDGPATDAPPADGPATDAPPADGPAADAGASDAPASDAPSSDAAASDAPVADLPAPDAAAVDMAPDTNPVPAVPVLPHKTDFLNVGCRTHIYGGLSAAQRKICRAAVKQRGYTHFYLYVYNDKDYGGPAFDYYLNISGFKILLGELIADGLAPVVWLFPDDATPIHTLSTAALKGKMTALVPGVDHLVSSYCLGLELDEYWNAAKVNDLGLHLRSMTSKKIAVHQLDGKWDFAKLSWADYMILQYGFGKNATYVKNMTAQCKADINKPVVAGEYALDDEPTGITLGNAAVAAGAAGFGNGGTP